MMDLENLSDRLRTSIYVVPLSQSEREFLAKLIQAHIRSRGRKEIADQKAIAVAQHVIWLEEFHDIKTEAAIADAAKCFDLKRSRITDILKEQRPKWDSLRSSARSDHVRQAYAMMEEERALIEKEDAFESPRVKRARIMSEYAEQHLERAARYAGLALPLPEPEPGAVRGCHCGENGPGAAPEQAAHHT